MKDPAKAASAHRVCATKEDHAEKKGNLTKYSQLVNYLLADNSTKDVIAKAEPDIINFKQPEGLSALRSSAVLWKINHAIVVYTIRHV